MPRHRLPTCALALHVVACMPLGDLDSATRGDGEGGSGAGGETASLEAGASGVLSRGGAAVSGESAGSGRSPTAGTQDGGRAGGAAGATGLAGAPVVDAGKGGAATGGQASSAGDSPGGQLGAPVGGSAGSDGSAGVSGARSLPDLPLELPDSPVEGQFTVSEEAVWEVDGVLIPTFEIHTPTGSYWLVKSRATIVSMVDAAGASARQWIDFSSGFRPLRGLPSFGSIGEIPTTFTTVVDEESRTPQHLRLTSETASRDWRLVWDFYTTHVTITILSAPVPFGFCYRGVPGGALDAMDSLFTSDGAVQSAQSSRVFDFPGDPEWVSVADASLGRALFLIHHGTDTISDRYQVRDNDSSMVLFGDGDLTSLPVRFSVGLIDSAEFSVIRARAEYVIQAIR